MKKYKWYLFDLDNTILDFSNSAKRSFFETLEFFSLPPTLYNYNVYNSINHSYWEKYEKGLITAETLRIGRFNDFLKKINADKEVSLVSKKYLDLLIHNSKEIHGAITIIKELNKKANLAIITNGLSDVQHKRIAKHELNLFFDFYFISDEMGVSKPAHKFFEIVHEKIGSPNKKDVLVIGDNPASDINGGNSFGYDTLFFNYNELVTDQIDSTYNIKNWASFKDL